MTSGRALGLCGLIAGVATMAGGYMDVPWLVGVGASIMFLGNCYALRKG